MIGENIKEPVQRTFLPKKCLQSTYGQKAYLEVGRMPNLEVKNTKM